MPSSRIPRRLQDIIDNAKVIFRYTEGIDLTAFEENRLIYDAVERCLERISEASAALGDMAAHLMPDQPWQKIRSFGNVLRHEYDAIREDRLFDLSRPICPACAPRPKRRCVDGRFPRSRKRQLAGINADDVPQLTLVVGIFFLCGLDDLQSRIVDLQSCFDAEVSLI